jgi:hypothetical protein
VEGDEGLREVVIGIYNELITTRPGHRRIAREGSVQSAGIWYCCE